MAGVFSKGKKRKLEDEGRVFQDSWEHDFFFIPAKKEGSAMCLLCRDVVQGYKRFNLNRHYKTVHSNFDNKYPKDSKLREQKLKTLKMSIVSEQKMMSATVSENKLITKASYEVAEILARKMKPFTDAEIFKECFLVVCDTLFSKFPNAKQIKSDIQKLQLSDSTCVRRVNEISVDMLLCTLDEIRECDYFSLALDSSTDISSTSQLLLFVKYRNKVGIIKEEFLTVIPMTGQTRGIDFFEAVKSFFDKYKIDLNKLLSVCTDGCPSMVGCHAGFISLLKKHLNRDQLLTYHCILHQENLAAKFDETFKSVMKKVINIVNFIRSHELNHRQFIEFLKELNSQYDDVIYHSEVRWLSKGRVLERFFNLRHEIKLFLSERDKEYPELEISSWWLKVGFMADITGILNDVQIKMQGRNKVITQLTSAIFSLEEKLKIYTEEFSNNDLTSFPCFHHLIQEDSEEEINLQPFIELLTVLRHDFSTRFNDFRKFRSPFRLVENPWSITTADVTGLSIFGPEIRNLKNELIDLQQDSELEGIFQEKRKTNSILEFWNTVPEKQFENLVSCAYKILCLFGSTYICEMTFSKIKFIKGKHRSRLTNVNLENLLRICVANQPARIDKIVEESSRVRSSTSQQ